MDIEKNKKLDNLVSIVGIANAGKSTLFNRIIGKKKSIVTDIAGTTRDNVMDLATWQMDRFWVMDTAGIMGETENEDIELKVEDQIELAIHESDLLLWVVDGSKDSLELDKKVLRRYKKHIDKIVLIVNKSDCKKKSLKDWDIESIGANISFKVSSKTGSGVGDVLEYVTDFLKENDKLDSIEVDEDTISVCFLGRPNVGKSSLINNICGEDARIVCDLPGTTRDVGEINVKYGDQKMKIYDTAGMRRMGRVHKKYIERYSIMRALGALRVSDVAVLLLDAEEELTRRDMGLARIICDMNKGLILFVNKWDLKNNEDDWDKFVDNLRRKLTYLYWVPVVYGSAKTGQNIQPLLKKIEDVNKNYNYRSELSDIKNLVFELIAKNQRLSTMGLTRIEQIGTAPPEFLIKLKSKKNFSSNDEKMLQDIIRDYFELRGVPIKLRVV